MLGKPHGLAMLTYTVSTGEGSDRRSFRGMGLMFQGELHGGPALFIRKDGHRLSTAFMNHGRPTGFLKEYNPDDVTAIV